MLIHQTICSVYIILVAEGILLSWAHPDCNHERVLNRFFYMCKSYSSIKREANVGVGLFPSNNPSGAIFPALGNWQQQQQQVPGTSDNRRVPSSDQQFQQPSPNFPSHYPWQITPNSPPNAGAPQQQQQDIQVHDHRVRRKEMQLPAALPNEPEDFTSFNNWYLNPVYADADWQSAIERWRRKSLDDEIWRFVQTKCCVKGCPFPDDFMELDKRVNICGMR